MGADVLDVVSGVVSGGRLIITSLLPRRLAGSRVVGDDRRVRVCELAPNVGLGLGCIVNHNDLLGEAVAVEILPIGLAGTATLPRGAAIGLAGCGHSSGGVLVGVVIRVCLVACGG
jgi:hypothetical protein